MQLTFKPHILTLFLLCTMAWKTDAQEYYPISWNENDTVLVFGDKVNIRSQASTESAPVTQLVAGEKLLILAAQDQKFTQNGYTMPWYKVKVIKSQQTGYIWGGLLSVISSAECDDVQFVAGITRMSQKAGEENREFQVEIRAVRAGAVVSKTSNTISNAGHFMYRPYVPGNRGLKDYKAVICLGMGYEACGYPWDDWYVLWNGKQLHSLPLCISVSDAGIFAHIETYVFPHGVEGEEGHYGPEDKIYFSVRHHEREDKEGDAGWNDSSWTRARAMRWDGKQWLKPKNMELPKY